jgi:hypothetical protein
MDVCIMLLVVWVVFDMWVTLSCQPHHNYQLQLKKFNYIRFNQVIEMEWHKYYTLLVKASMLFWINSITL